MSALVNNLMNLERRVDLGGVSAGIQNAVRGRPSFGRYYGETPPAPPGPPTQDTAANAALQTQQQLLRRRGVLANIYAGGAAGTPTTASKSTLGD